jgi:hypothetical protein
MGHVLKENFEASDEGDFSMEKYHKELEENPVCGANSHDLRLEAY